jgi:hypothetical protein
LATQKPLESLDALSEKNKNSDGKSEFNDGTKNRKRGIEGVGQDRGTSY